MRQPATSGLEAAGPISWGTHFCQFYSSKDDLFETIVPYMKAGLEANEFCVWLTSPEVIDAREAEAALRRAVPDLDRYLAERRIEFPECGQWYRDGGRFDANNALKSLLELTSMALKQGFDGLRAAGSGALAWLEQEKLEEYIRYESDLDRAVSTRRMLVLCPYPLGKCGPREIIDAAANHEFALMRGAKGWQVLENTARRKSSGSSRSSRRWPATVPNSSAFAAWISCRLTSTRPGFGWLAWTTSPGFGRPRSGLSFFRRIKSSCAMSSCRASTPKGGRKR